MSIDVTGNSIIERSRRFYKTEVAPMIHEKFPEAEARIAVGIAGEGSDCFGFDDYVSRDHDFGTGVCLWLTDEDYEKYGNLLSILYNELVNKHDSNLTERLMERRGVMMIHSFYSNILNIDCDTDNCIITEEDWKRLDHNCLATAVNGAVFRDDLGEFTKYRNALLNYYPEHIWKERIEMELHMYAQAMQVNYARCMTRKDIVAAEMCRAQGLNSAMQLYYLLNRTYPPYYKWTFKMMESMEKTGDYAELVAKLAGTYIDSSKWEGLPYVADRLNLKDEIVSLTERIATRIAMMMKDMGLVKYIDPYLEQYVGKI
ncbi:MAG: DUF4037 domain-containing protein [Lachnospiraceae bacterium]|nr:DUF4037 domain-containing protein [Lachnospiraceae bacterium]